MEQIDVAIFKQQHNKHMSTAMNKHATIEDMVFSMQPLLGCTLNLCPWKQTQSRGTVGSSVLHSLLMSYKEDQWAKEGVDSQLEVGDGS
jgi:hypothetical protein